MRYIKSCTVMFQSAAFIIDAPTQAAPSLYTRIWPSHSINSRQSIEEVLLMTIIELPAEMTSAMKKPYYQLLLFLGLSIGLSVGLFISGHAQITPHRDTTAMFVNFVAEPSYPGGIPELKKYLMANVKYPAAADSANIKGRVFVSFVIEIDGQLTGITVLKGLGYGCDEEAVRVVKAMPHWLPGRQSDKLVRVKYNLPVLFGQEYSKRKGLL